MFDYHMHSQVSFDSREAPEKMVQAALDAGLKEICFTDHIDDDPAGVLMDWRFTMADYHAAYDALTADGLKIRRGVEFGLLADNMDNLSDLLRKGAFDFVLGSIHYADGLDVYHLPYWEGKTLWQAERKYLQDTLLCVQNHDNFDVLGHLTYLSKARCHPTHTPIRMEDHRELVDEILKTLVRKGKGMEINSSGVDRCGDFLPGKAYLQRFRELGGEIVTMGSDAHTADRVGQYAPQTLQILREVFGYVCTFEARVPIFHKL